MSYRRRKKKKWNAGVIWVLLVLALLVGILAYQTAVKRQTELAQEARIGELESQIEDENKKTQELEIYSIFTRTMKYIEQIAREKLGLVYPGEVIVEPEK